MMDFLPIGICVKDLNVVVIGGGNVAAQKLRTLVKTSARLYVYADNICPEIKSMNVTWVECRYTSELLNEARLVYACTNDRELNRQIGEDASAINAVVNVADDPSHCQFISLALWTNEHMSVAVSSDAKSPSQSVRWRNKIREFLENDLVSR